MSLAGLWPREQSRPTDSQAEQRVYDALSRILPNRSTAWHSLCGQTAEDGIACRQSIGAIPVVRAHDPEMGTQIVADTFLRFKGLERPAVIVTDLRLVTDRADVRMHIALTRALDAVRVVAAREDLGLLPEILLH